MGVNIDEQAFICIISGHHEDCFVFYLEPGTQQHDNMTSFRMKEVQGHISSTV